MKTYSLSMCNANNVYPECGMKQCGPIIFCNYISSFISEDIAV